MPSVLDRANLEKAPLRPADPTTTLRPTVVDVVEGHRDDALRRTPSKLKRWSLKTKAILHVKTAPEFIKHPVPTLAPLHATPGEPPGLRLDGEKALGSGEKFVAFVKNPVDTVKSAAKSQGGLALSQNLITQEISHGHDVQVVQAHEELLEAEGTAAEEEAEIRLEGLKRSRQDMFMRWALDRHVLKIRRLDRAPIPLRPRADFTVLDDTGNPRTDWIRYVQHILQRNAEKYGGQYIGAYSEPPYPNQGTVASAVERLVVSSTPVQAGLLKLRRLYRWENRTQTSTCLAIFLVLWSFDFLLQAVLLFFIICVLQRRSHKTSVRDLREDLVRVEDKDELSLNLIEHVEKHGQHVWTDSLVDVLGPRLLLQLNDAADLMEVILSFYEWRSPNRTTYSLSIIGALALIVTFTPTWLIVKSGTLFAGFVFFALFPIASRYPNYRFLVSPVRWLFWDIPSHPEWAITRLQFEGYHQKKEALLQHNARVPDNPLPPDSNYDFSKGHSAETPITNRRDEIDLLRFQATYKPSGGKLIQTHQGKLILSTLSVRFETSIRKQEQWRISFDQLSRVEKVDFTAKFRKGQDILFTDVNGLEYRADNLLKRDEVFAQIMGYSEVNWQIIG